MWGFENRGGGAWRIGGHSAVNNNLRGAIWGGSFVRTALASDPEGAQKRKDMFLELRQLFYF